MIWNEVTFAECKLLILKLLKNITAYHCWCMVLPWAQGVVGSNPIAPTKQSASCPSVFVRCCPHRHGSVRCEPPECAHRYTHHTPEVASNPSCGQLQEPSTTLRP